eukprot:s3057_g14.t1
MDRRGTSDLGKPVMLLANFHQSSYEQLGFVTAQLEKIIIEDATRDMSLPTDAIRKIDEAKSKLDEALQIVLQKANDLHAQVLGLLQLTKMKFQGSEVARWRLYAIETDSDVLAGSPLAYHLVDPIISADVLQAAAEDGDSSGKETCSVATMSSSVPTTGSLAGTPTTKRRSSGAAGAATDVVTVETVQQEVTRTGFVLATDEALHNSGTMQGIVKIVAGAVRGQRVAQSAHGVCCSFRETETFGSKGFAPVNVQLRASSAVPLTILPVCNGRPSGVERGQRGLSGQLVDASEVTAPDLPCRMRNMRLLKADAENYIAGGACHVRVVAASVPIKQQPRQRVAQPRPKRRAPLKAPTARRAGGCPPCRQNVVPRATHGFPLRHTHQETSQQWCRRRGNGRGDGGNVRQEVTLTGFVLATDEALHNSGTKRKGSTAREVGGFLLADGESLIQIALWGEVAKRWFPRLQQWLDQTEEGQFPQVEITACQVSAYRGPTAPQLRRLQSTARTTLRHVDSGPLVIAPSAAMLATSATQLMTSPLVSCFQGVVTRVESLGHTRDDTCLKEIGVTMANGFEVPVMLYGIQAEEDVAVADAVTVWFGESRRALADREGSEGMVWLFSSGYLLNLGQVPPSAPGRPLNIGGAAQQSWDDVPRRGRGSEACSNEMAKAFAATPERRSGTATERHGGGAGHGQLAKAETGGPPRLGKAAPRAATRNSTVLGRSRLSLLVCQPCHENVSILLCVPQSVAHWACTLWSCCMKVIVCALISTCLASHRASLRGTGAKWISCMVVNNDVCSQRQVERKNVRVERQARHQQNANTADDQSKFKRKEPKTAAA